MQNLIKNIRAYMNMNQSEFSKRLDVSFATVNRWENGHATPGRQAQEKLYALCGEQKVPMDNMIFAKIRKMAEGLQIAPNIISRIKVRNFWTYCTEKPQTM